ncbi:unnamed protein product [Cylindrotheca closterium]|uniref:Uncharacterized protein n=1 Tax=Cylindrotheca closterium TaxID=2856 RepID=A0AAD2JLP2_9STRA|nr:unnamed protein product [Cylindrotheca closterium]
MTIIGTSIPRATRIFFLLASLSLFLLQDVSAQKENKEPKAPKNQDPPPPSISNVPSLSPTIRQPSLVPTPEDSSNPTSFPSAPPTPIASDAPSSLDSNSPTDTASDVPTDASDPPTMGPSDAPSLSPTERQLQSSSETPTTTVGSDIPVVDDSAAPSMATSTAPSMATSASPSEPSIEVSTPPTELDSAAPTVSESASPSQLPSILGASAQPSMTASMPPSAQPSTSSVPSDLPSTTPSMNDDQNNNNTTGLQCVDDPSFTNLTPDAFGNVTNCAWFEYYVFNSCQDFGGWTDSNGNTPNASCCVCGGGLLVDPDAPSPTTAPVSEPPTTPMRCGCRSCTDEIWNKPTGTSSFSCGDRISFLMQASGGSLSEARACYQIGHDEYPDDCKFCDSQHCVLDDPTDHFHCGCPSCGDEAWDADADGESCGDRIMFLQNELNVERRKACEQVGFLEFPDQCGSCDPNTCAATRSSSPARLLESNTIFKTMLTLPILVYLTNAML